MTYWTLPDTHRGTSPDNNPIKKFAEDGKSKLYFPGWHPMVRWMDNKGFFTEIGRFGDVGNYCACKGQFSNSSY